MHRWRGSEGAAACEVWGGKQASGNHGLSRYTDVEDLPGVHLPWKVQECILGGYYLVVFSFLKPEGEAGITSTKRDKKGASKGSSDQTFQNWSVDAIRL